MYNEMHGGLETLSFCVLEVQYRVALDQSPMHTEGRLS